ncbi:IclR family transcriptional regulator [Xylophilus sp. GOD-11R]|uniref:IclR family transcriptional regulator n=1 Tax=Xylophilus sp. GOD-11R TaxID=3089814 RepID=UPI00298D0971|nr:IclR family transcriptional regulator [Xylophilus sp. GOD-11R]WPB58262.1 IclR family transcriptional regulator [Xylophilus sp. GOD-11R]
MKRKTSPTPGALPFGNAPMETEGAQSIQRALRVLKYAVSRTGGITLTEAVDASGLTKPTVHRILAALVEEGFLQVGDDARVYLPGPESLAVGLSASRTQNIRALAEPSLHRLAATTQNTIYLSIPSGWDSICVDCVVGDYPIRILTLNIGERRPLGISAGGLALLAFRPQAEIDALVRDNPNLPYPGITIEQMLGDIREAQRTGYAFNPGRMIPEMSGIGVPVFDQEGRIIAALSMATLASRLQGDDLLQARRLLEEEARAITALELAGRQA